MNAAAHRAAPEDAAGIGPGPLVLVCGPSGAGKDTLIKRASEILSHDRRVVFVRRVVTRAPSPFEDNVSVDSARFRRMAEDGAFAFWWEAHGHHYAIPSSVNSDIASGRAAVANVSRLAIEEISRAYQHAITVLITASDEILRERLGSRAREKEQDVASRLTRSQETQGRFRPDATIVNEGAIDIAANSLVGVIRNGLLAANASPV